MRMTGKAADAYLHICHVCQGKAAKKLWRQIVKRQKRKEERQWRREDG